MAVHHGYFSRSRHCPIPFSRSCHHITDERHVIPQTNRAWRPDIKPGALAVHDRALVVIKQRDGSQVTVRDLISGKLFTVPVGELRGRDAGRLTELLDQRATRLRDDDEVGRPLARAREQTLVAMLSASGLSSDRVTNAAQQLNVSCRAVYRWLRRYRELATTSSLVDRNPGPTKGRSKLDAVREALLREIIDDHYLKQPRLTPEAIYREAYIAAKPLACLRFLAAPSTRAWLVQSGTCAVSVHIQVCTRRSGPDAWRTFRRQRSGCDADRSHAD